jgi:hypothetical protein
VSEYRNPITGRALIPDERLQLSDVPDFDYTRVLYELEPSQTLDAFCLSSPDYRLDRPFDSDKFLLHWVLQHAFSSPSDGDRPAEEIKDLSLARGLLFAHQRCAHNEPDYDSGFPGSGAYLNWLLDSVRSAIRLREAEWPDGDGPHERDEDLVFSRRFAAALQYAFGLHGAQRRKGSGVPYIGHLLGVCALVIEDGGDEDEAIAALLHDGPEDAGGQETLEAIGERFGLVVKEIVSACSDTFETPKPPWRERKERYIAHLGSWPPALRVSLADKLFNARAIVRDYKLVGDQLWDRFAEGEESQLWYYRALADRFQELLPGQMADDLSATVAELAQLICGGGELELNISGD